jgi:hypothetical protein
MGRQATILTKAILWSLAAFAAPGFSENVLLSGVVLNEDSLPIPHAYVSLPRLNLGDSTDANGSFALRAGAYTSTHPVLARGIRVSLEGRNLVVMSDRHAGNLEVRAINLVGATLFSVAKADLPVGRTVIQLPRLAGEHVLRLEIDGHSSSMRYIDSQGRANLGSIDFDRTPLARSAAIKPDSLLVYSFGKLVNKIPAPVLVDSALTLFASDSTPILAQWDFPPLNGDVKLSQTSGLMQFGSYTGFRADLYPDTGYGVMAVGNEWDLGDPGIGIIAQYSTPKDFSAVSTVKFTLKVDNPPTLSPGIQSYVQNGSNLKYAGDYNFWTAAPTRQFKTYTYTIDKTAAGLNIKTIASFRIKANGAVNQPSGTGCGDPDGTCAIVRIRKVIFQ